MPNGEGLLVVLPSDLHTVYQARDRPAMGLLQGMALDSLIPVEGRARLAGSVRVAWAGVLPSVQVRGGRCTMREARKQCLVDQISSKCIAKDSLDGYASSGM